MRGNLDDATGRTPEELHAEKAETVARELRARAVARGGPEALVLQYRAAVLERVAKRVVERAQRFS